MSSDAHPSISCSVMTVDLEVGQCYQFRFRREGEWIKAGSCVLLFSLYSQPAFYTGYIVYAASLLIPTSKWIFSQQHRRIQVDEAETAQASHKMGGRRDSQPDSIIAPTINSVCLARQTAA